MIIQVGGKAITSNFFAYNYFWKGNVIRQYVNVKFVIENSISLHVKSNI